MKKSITAVVILTLGFALQACGKKGELEPPERDSLAAIEKPATKG